MTTSWTASDAPPVPTPVEGVRLWLVAGKDPLKEGGGGHSTYVRMWGVAARLAGFDPQILCISARNTREDTAFGVVHHVRSPLARLPDRYGTAVRTHTVLWHRGLLARALVRAVMDEPPSAQAATILHGFGIWSVCAVDAGRTLRHRGRAVRVLMTAYCCTAHEYLAKWRGLTGGGWRNRWRYGWDMLALTLGVDRMERIACHGADEVLINYESVRQLLTARFGAGIPFRRVAYSCEREVMESPITAVRTPEAVGACPRLVAISRHDPRKGLGVLLEALAVLHREGVAFQATLVGGGPLLEANRQRARDLGLTGVVALVGFQPDAFTPLVDADVFVLPSLEESSGSLSMLEAMEQGKAIVASDLDGIPEDVSDGESALLVPPGDAPALAAALRRVLTDPALRARLGAAASATFEQRFSRAAVLRDLRAVYLPMARSSSSLPSSL